MKLKNKIGIDIFSGAGGLSLGAINASIDVKIAIDNDKYSAETFQFNHPETVFFFNDIKNIETENLLDEQPFIIFGGPPCQGFSYSNKKTRNLNNDKNSLFEEFIRFVSYFKPKWFLFENVEGIIEFNHGNTIKEIKENFEEIGYRTFDKILTASDYGVPQNRNRYFLVGNNAGIDFNFPEKENEKISVWEAISDLPRLKNGDKYDELPYNSDCQVNKYQNQMRGDSKNSFQNYVSLNKEYIIDRYKHIQQGQNWRAIPSELMNNYKDTKNCHSGIYRRLEADKPSVVISNYRKNMLIHPYHDRGLSVREAARLQSFPDNFIFKGTLWYIQQQIGNAVPPLLAEKIFKQIIQLDT